MGEQRTRSRTFCFKHAFTLSDVEGELPAGDYVVETTDEMIDGLSFPSYRRLWTTISLPGSSSKRSGQRPMSRQVVTINPIELDDAISKDDSHQTEGNPAVKYPSFVAEKRSWKAMAVWFVPIVPAAFVFALWLLNA